MFLLVIVSVPQAEAGLYTDITDWFRELFGMDVRVSDTNFNNFNGYYIASDKEMYNCFLDNNKELDHCQKSRFGVKNNNKYTDHIYIEPEFFKDVDIQKIEIRDEINSSLWYEQIIYDTSNKKYNKKKVDRIKIKSGETINFRITYLPKEKYSGKFNICVYSDKEGMICIDPYYNLTNGLPVGPLDGEYGIHKYKWNYYIIHPTGAGGNFVGLMNYTPQGVNTNNLTIDGTCEGAGELFDVTGNGSGSFFVTGFNGAASYFLCEVSTDGTVIQNKDITVTTTGARGIVWVNDTTLATVDRTNGIVRYWDQFLNPKGAIIGANTCINGPDFKGMSSNGTGGYWIVDNSNNVICSYSSNFTNQSGGFTPGSFGISNPFGIINDTGNGVKIVDNTDDFVYSLGPNNPPTINNISFSPGTIYLNQSINCSFGMEDLETGIIDLRYNLSWFEDNVFKFSFNKSSLGTINSEVLDRSNYTEFDVGKVWKCEVYGHDGTDRGFTNLTSKTIESLITLNSLKFEQVVAEGQQTTLTINLTLLDGTLTNSNLSYNGSIFSGTISTFTGTPNGTNYLISRSVIVPDFLGTTNVSFHFEIASTFEGSSNFTGTAGTQEVKQMDIGLCDATNNILFVNYSLVDEETQEFIDNSTFKTEIEYDFTIQSDLNRLINFTTFGKAINQTALNLCFPFNVTNSSATYRLDGVTRFEAGGHVIEYYHWDNFVVNNVSIPQHINLYDLNTTDSTSFLVTFFNKFFIPVENAIIEVWRNYVADGTFKKVETAKTDAEGQTRVHLVAEDVRYFFIIRLNGTLLWTTPQSLALCISVPCQFNIFASEGIGDFDNFEVVDNLNFELDLDEDTNKVTLTYSTSDGTDSRMDLEITEFTGLFNRSIANLTTTGSSGVLTHTVTSDLLNRTYLVEVRKDGTKIKWEMFDLSIDKTQIFGETGIIFGGVAILAMGLMAVSSGPVGVIMFTLIGIIFASLMFFTKIGYAAIVWFIVAGLIIVVKVWRRPSTP